MSLMKAHIRPMRRHELQGMERVDGLQFQSLTLIRSRVAFTMPEARQFQTLNMAEARPRQTKIPEARPRQISW